MITYAGMQVRSLKQGYDGHWWGFMTDQDPINHRTRYWAVNLSVDSDYEAPCEGPFSDLEAGYRRFKFQLDPTAEPCNCLKCEPE